MAAVREQVAAQQAGPAPAWMVVLGFSCLLVTWWSAVYNIRVVPSESMAWVALAMLCSLLFGMWLEERYLAPKKTQDREDGGDQGGREHQDELVLAQPVVGDPARDSRGPVAAVDGGRVGDEFAHPPASDRLADSSHGAMVRGKP